MNESMCAQMETINLQIKELASIYRDAAGKFGISSNELWIWYALLDAEGAYTQQDICDMWFLPKQTVNSIVTNLARKEMVILEAVPGTRNRKIIHLTEKGREYGERVIRPLCRAEQDALARMPDEERQTCILLLGKYIAFLKDEINEK